jgi:hypothetical protein
MLKDIRIYCTGFLWDPGLIGNDFHKVNFFSIVNGYAQYTNFTKRIEISKYIIEKSCSDISADLERMRKEAGIYSYFRTASDFDFEVSDIVTFLTSMWGGVEAVYKPRDFFQLMSNSSYIKYLIEIEEYKNGNWGTLYMGFVNQNGIKENIMRSSDSHKIKIQVVGMEKEFKNYFMAKKLSEYNFNYNGQFQFGVPLLTGYFNPRYFSLSILLTTLFKTTPTQVDPTTNYFRMDIEPPTGVHGGCNSLFDYRGGDGVLYDMEPVVVEKPFLVRQPNTKCIFFQSGFEVAIAENCSAYEWLEKVCNSYGWIFQIKYKATSAVTKAYLILRNRYEVMREPVYEINRTNLLSDYELGKAEPTTKCPAIIIRTGCMDYSPNFKNYLPVAGHQNYYATGERGLLISTFDKDLIKFTSFEDIAIDGNGYHPLADSYLQIVSIIENEITLRMYDKNVGFYGEFKHKLNDFLILDTGSHAVKCRCNFTDKKNWENVTSPLTDMDITFGGNYGCMIGFINHYENRYGNGQQVYTYDDWVRGKTHLVDQASGQEIKHKIFYNNFKILLNTITSNIKATVKINERLTEFDKTFKFNNELGLYGNVYDFSLSRYKISLYNKITELSLINQ